MQRKDLQIFTGAFIAAIITFSLSTPYHLAANKLFHEIGILSNPYSLTGDSPILFSYLIISGLVCFVLYRLTKWKYFWRSFFTTGAVVAILHYFFFMISLSV